MSMVTKAGVPATKVIIGMALYGRSFKMTDPGCYGPECHFTGPESGATAGDCTVEPGYLSNYEIRKIIAENGNVQQYGDNDGDILVYDDVQWVAWMSRSMYESRVDWITGLNFGGIADWAVDLEAEFGDGDGSDGGDDGSGPVIISPDIYGGDNPEIACQPPCTLVFPPWTLDIGTTISIEPETVTYEENWETTLTISDAIITTSGVSITSTVINIPAITTKTISVWDQVWDEDDDDDDDNGVIWLTPSVPIPPVIVTNLPVPGVDRPPVTWTYMPGPWPPIPDGPDLPAPPPPPPGFPSTVQITAGPAMPTCGPGQDCGSVCQENCNPADAGCAGVCGCIGPFCPDGSCVGPGCGAGGNGDDPDECRVKTTISECRIDCSELHWETTETRCGDPVCSRTRTTCTGRGSTSTTTTTME